MTFRHHPTAVLAATFGVLFALAGVRAQQAPAAPTGPLAPTKYKNIQVLTDVPADQLDLTMRYFSAATGLQCLSCHVMDQATGEWQYDKDDKTPKKTARSMIKLVQTVNAGDFGGRVNCGTCHAGRNQPAGLQLAAMMTPEQIAAAAARQGGPGAGGPGGAPGGARPGGAPGAGGPPPAGGQPGGGRGQQGPPPPPLDDVLTKYIAALGGEAALAKLQSRVMSGTLTNRSGQASAFTIEEKGMKYRETWQSQPAAVSRVFDGTAGWVLIGDRALDLDGFLLRQALRGGDLGLPLQMKQRYQNLTAGRPTRIAGAPGTTPVDVNLISGSPYQYVTERFYFDTTTGLLVRRTVTTTATPATLRGNLTEQYDYADYRDVAGVKMPFSITRTNWNTLDTLKVVDVKPNASIDDARFSRPK
jgi:hypothetical protein